jgi:hypothetical protein
MELSVAEPDEPESGLDAADGAASGS